VKAYHCRDQVRFTVIPLKTEEEKGKRMGNGDAEAKLWWDDEMQEIGLIYIPR
jgi:hypothetical protein